MGVEHERRRHQRYPLRLDVQVLRGVQRIPAQVINVSLGGCLLLAGMPLELNDILELSLPQLELPTARLYVVQSQSTDLGWLAAACYEAALADASQLNHLAEQFQRALPQTRTLH
jgi:hypothetical protein